MNVTEYLDILTSDTLSNEEMELIVSHIRLELSSMPKSKKKAVIMEQVLHYENKLIRKQVLTSTRGDLKPALDTLALLSEAQKSHHNSELVATQTLSDLKQQTETINSLSNMNNELNYSNRILTQMKSWWR